jgi:hypothetical protein
MKAISRVRNKAKNSIRFTFKSLAALPDEIHSSVNSDKTSHSVTRRWMSAWLRPN